MKKIFTILIIVICVLVVLPVGVFAACFITDSGKDVSKYKDFNQNTLVTTKMASSLDKIKENEGLTFTFDSEDINGLLYKLHEEKIVPTGYGDYVKKFYCDSGDNGKWTFTAVGGWKFINTKIILPTTLESDSENIKFTLNDPTVGRVNLGFVRKYVNQFAEKMGLNNLISDALTNIGITGATVDIINTGEIKIPKSGLVGILNDKLGSVSNPFYSSLMKMFMNEGKDLINLETNKEIGLKLDLRTLEDNEKFKKPKREILTKFRDERLPKYIEEVKKEKLTEKEKVEESLRNKISADEIVTGGSKNFIETIKGTANDITKDQIEGITTTKPLELGNITATDMFNFSRTFKDIVAKPTCFTANIVEGEQTIAYTMFDSMDYRFYKDADGNNRLNAYLTPNVNGLPLVIILDYKIDVKCQKADDPTKIVLGDVNNTENNKIYIGEKELKGDSKKEMLDLISLAIKKEGDNQLFAFNPDNGTIELDIPCIFDENEQGGKGTVQNAFKQALKGEIAGVKCHLAVESIPDETNINGGSLKLQLVKDSEI